MTQMMNHAVRTALHMYAVPVAPDAAADGSLRIRIRSRTESRLCADRRGIAVCIIGLLRVGRLVPRGAVVRVAAVVRRAALPGRRIARAVGRIVKDRRVASIAGSGRSIRAGAAGRVLFRAARGRGIPLDERAALRADQRFIGNLLAAVIACLHILPPVLVCVFLFYGKRAGKSIEESPSPRKRPEGRKKEPPRREALSFA